MTEPNNRGLNFGEDRILALFRDTDIFDHQVGRLDYILAQAGQYATSPEVGLLQSSRVGVYRSTTLH